MTEAKPTTPFISDQRLAGVDGIIHGFFTRNGGISEGLYGTLNGGPGSSDDVDNVARNRDLAAAALGLDPGAIITAHQTHSTDVIRVETPWALDGAPKADGLVTATSGIGLGILAADCAPVLLADGGAQVIGAAHAGWRGALGGIIEATVAAMEDLGAGRGRITAAVGPSIGQASYEVGPEFPAPFLAQDPGAENFFRAAPRDRHYLFDLSAYVAACLARAGLKSVKPAQLDTCAMEDRFFSYRRSFLNGEPDYGRNISVIALKE
ncbi:MAG: peptidoglycan editing factor PgeF [Alphaproteobacteria bacterium]|nr:peptidoglycan editing factor PgeF [Alphaproteobacteria bacterium]